MRTSRAVCGLLLSLLAGCATLDESQCRSVNWFELGSRDGSLGYSESRLQAHGEACSEFGLSADAAAWRNGYAQGLQSYCSADNGYRIGRQGGHYGRVCSLEDEPDFLAAYDLGRETLDLDQEIARVTQYADSIQSRLAQDRALSDDARRDLRYQLSESYRELSWLRRSRDRLEAEWRRQLRVVY